MIDPRNPTLETGAVLRVGSSIDQTAILPRGGRDRTSLALADGGVDRSSLTRFLIILIALFTAYLAAGPSLVEGEWGLVNAVCPILLCLTALWTGYKTITSNPRTIWTPMPWFTLVTALYYGFGPLLYVFGNQAAIDDMNDFWSVGPYDLWCTNLLNAVSLGVVIAAFLVADRLLGAWRSTDRPAASTSTSGDDSARTATYVFLCIGLPVQFLFVLPTYFTESEALPGIIKGLNNLVFVAVFMLAYLGAKRGGLWRHGFWLLFVIEALSSAVTLMKQEILQVFIMAVLGRFLARRNVKELVFSGIGVVGFYVVVLSPVITWSRLRLAQEYADQSGSPSGRLSVMCEGLLLLSTQGELNIEAKDRKLWWARLCYPNAQAAAMHFYDSGVAGDSFMYVTYSWIPRFLWPDKPIMDLGRQFNTLVQGSDHNNTGPGVFAEAYWNGGWLMVVLACSYVGVLFAWFTHLAFRILERSEWLFLPCLFTSIIVGLRIDDWFGPTHVTGCLICMAYYGFIRLILGFGQNRD